MMIPPRTIARCAIAITLIVAALQVFAQAPPKRNLTVELRQLEEPPNTARQASSAGLTVRTQRPDDNAPALQQVQVLNGERASLRLARSMPLQWVQAAAAQASSRTASAAVSSSRGGGAVNAVTWLEAGHSLTVQPRWPGGKQAVTIEVQVDTAAIDDRVGADLPAQSRSHAGTTVVAPLGQWITIATTGAGPQREQPGVYSSESAAGNPRQLIQVRVLAP